MAKTKKHTAAGKKLSFRSRLENWAKGMDYGAIPVPAAVTKKLGTTAAVLVMAQVNSSEPFKVSLFPVGGGKHYIRVRKKVRLAAGLLLGSPVTVKIQVLDRHADAILPKDLEKALRAEGLLQIFNSIPPGARNYILRQIGDAVRVETRNKRILAAVELTRKKTKKVK